jgi:hypothetical protein
VPETVLVEEDGLFDEENDDFVDEGDELEESRPRRAVSDGSNTTTNTNTNSGAGRRKTAGQGGEYDFLDEINRIDLRGKRNKRSDRKERNKRRRNRSSRKDGETEENDDNDEDYDDDSDDNDDEDDDDYGDESDYVKGDNNKGGLRRTGSKSFSKSFDKGEGDVDDDELVADDAGVITRTVSGEQLAAAQVPGVVGLQAQWALARHLAPAAAVYFDYIVGE